MNIWNHIPLIDYEKHMSHATVGQMQLLSRILEEKLKQYSPTSLTVWGIAGGNGLEHINPNITKEVIGIDINNEYLNECKKRFADSIPNLRLSNIDLECKNTRPTIKTNLIWAALVFEYVDTDNVLEYAKECLNNKDVISITIQQDNENDSVSKTGIESIKQVSSIFKTITKEKIIKYAQKYNFNLVAETENLLDSGKSFITLDLENIK